MEVIKRDKTRQAYSREKIKQAIRKAFIAQGEAIDETLLTTITTAVETALPAIVSVEYIQDQVEKQLMAHGCYPQAKAYILYREEHARLRHAIEELAALAQDVRLIPLFKQIRRDFPDPLYSLSTLLAKYRTLIKDPRLCGAGQQRGAEVGVHRCPFSELADRSERRCPHGTAGHSLFL